MAPVAQLLPPLGPEARDKVSKDLKLLQLCPVAVDLELGVLAGELLRLGLGGEAVRLLPYIGLKGDTEGEVWDRVRQIQVSPSETWALEPQEKQQIIYPSQIKC